MKFVWGSSSSSHGTTCATTEFWWWRGICHQLWMEWVLGPLYKTRWWQLKYFLFSPLPGEDSHFDFCIFFRWVVQPPTSKLGNWSEKKPYSKSSFYALQKASKSSFWREPYCWWKKSCTSWYGKYPIIYRVLYIPGGAGFLPSTVLSSTALQKKLAFGKVVIHQVLKGDWFLRKDFMQLWLGICHVKFSEELAQTVLVLLHSGNLT